MAPFDRPYMTFYLSAIKKTICKAQLSQANRPL